MCFLLLNYRLQSELFKNELSETNFVLLISDLDRFKKINDTLGHHVYIIHCLTVVAEGVEDMRTLLKLRNLGCDTVQGYLFSSAVSEQDFLNCIEQYYDKDLVKLLS
ncbi:hypothetical protein MNBD_GAMMA22-333 [hydrothermal vent metagenome]|uniref:EAL domain-containing protein n=1 Tax=hydrothermal vent metagenome TaxID=652676 RepID=A0A3B0ZY80_9ZZZZ